jgi:hypothetical protein
MFNGGALQSNNASLTIETMVLVQALSWAINERETALIDYLSSRATLLQISLPNWLRLSLALLKNDKSELQRLLQQPAELPIADKMVALERLGRKSEAISLGLNELNDHHDEATRSQIRQLLVGQRQHYENGYRLGFQSQQRGALSVEQSEVLIQHRDGDQVFSLLWQPSKIDGIAPVISAPLSESDVTLNWRSLGEHQDWQLALNYSEREWQSNIGATLSYSRQLDASLNAKVSVADGVRSQLSGPAWLTSYEQQAIVSLNQSWDSRLTSGVNFGWRQLKGMDDKTIARGFGLDASLDFKVFVADPSWVVNGSFQWYRFNQSAALSPAVLYYFQQPITAEFIVPEKFGRIGFSSRWYHGSVHQIAHQVPSPRWHFAVNVGYQWPRDVTDYGISTGLGWRIFGDDELALSADWSSEDALGDSNWTLWLSYNRSIGR